MVFSEHDYMIIPRMFGEALSVVQSQYRLEMQICLLYRGLCLSLQTLCHAELQNRY